jgi:hypothetical protein
MPCLVEAGAVQHGDARCCTRFTPLELDAFVALVAWLASRLGSSFGCILSWSVYWLCYPLPRSSCVLCIPCCAASGNGWLGLEDVLLSHDLSPARPHRDRAPSSSAAMYVALVSLCPLFLCRRAIHTTASAYFVHPLFVYWCFHGCAGGALAPAPTRRLTQRRCTTSRPSTGV